MAKPSQWSDFDTTDDYSQNSIWNFILTENFISESTCLRVIVCRYLVEFYRKMPPKKNSICLIYLARRICFRVIFSITIWWARDRVGVSSLSGSESDSTWTSCEPKSIIFSVSFLFDYIVVFSLWLYCCLFALTIVLSFRFDYRKTTLLSKRKDNTIVKAKKQHYSQNEKTTL
jgi:hypothetical protein